MLVLVIADSRGRGLNDVILSTNFKGEGRGITHSGAGILTAVTWSLSSISLLDPKYIIIMAGICNITHRDSTSKLTSLGSCSNIELIDCLLDETQAAYKAIHQISHCTVSNATITGVDLADYCNPRCKHMTEVAYNPYCLHDKTVHADQHRLNKIILAVNHKLTALNQQHESSTVWMASGIHTYYSHTYQHRYSHLRDGCHSNDKTLAYRARQIARTSNLLKL